MWTRWLWAALLISLVEALHFNAPAAFQQHVLSPILCELIGSQDVTRAVTGRAVYVELEDCGSPSFNSSLVSGNIPFVFNPNNPVSISAEESVAACLERAGALAVVRLSGVIATPGFQYYWNDGHIKGSVTVPFLNVAYLDMKDITVAMQNRVNITVTTTIDTNPWRTELFDSIAFLIVMRIGLAALNGLGVIISLEALISHIHRLFFDTTAFPNKTVKRTVQLMALGSFFELVSCVVRCVHCGMGPVFSTSTIYFANHMFLFYSTVAIDMATTFIAIALFLRWGAFGKVDSWLKKHLESILLIVGIAFAVVTMVLAAFQAYRVSNLIIMIVVGTAFGFVCLFFSSGAFLIAGLRFVKQLQEAAKMQTTDQARTKSLKKAARWIALSGVFLIFQVIGACLAVLVSLLYQPVWHFILFALIYYGMSAAGCSHAFAFRPIAESHTTIVVKLASITKSSMRFSRSSSKQAVRTTSASPIAHVLEDDL